MLCILAISTYKNYSKSSPGLPIEVNFLIVHVLEHFGSKGFRVIGF